MPRPARTAASPGMTGATPAPALAGRLLSARRWHASRRTTRSARRVTAAGAEATCTTATPKRHGMTRRPRGAARTKDGCSAPVYDPCAETRRRQKRQLPGDPQVKGCMETSTLKSCQKGKCKPTQLPCPIPKCGRPQGMPVRQDCLRGPAC